MQKTILALMLSLFVMVSCKQTNNEGQPTKTSSTEVAASQAEYAIVIHGGAGTITKERTTPEQEKEYLAKMHEALNLGESILSEGGSALDAVEQTIRLMEDSPLFNAGKGAVFTHEGKNELDASIMNGENQTAGAIGGVTNIKNPISTARAVMEKSKHVLMVGKGAEAFAKSQGLEIVDPAYFKTDARWDALQRALKKEELNEKMGTVGCVALDRKGNIVAGTSTGGMTNKKYNRIGDSPIIGAGTYADNNTCGVSCTGHGEYFIRYTVARDIAAIMEYGDKSLEEASHFIINEKLVKKGGSGGIVALDKYGNISMKFNSAGMYRGYAKPGERMVSIYGDNEPLHNQQLATQPIK